MNIYNVYTCEYAYIPTFSLQVSPMLDHDPACSWPLWVLLLTYPPFDLYHAWPLCTSPGRSSRQSGSQTFGGTFTSRTFTASPPCARPISESCQIPSSLTGSMTNLPWVERQRGGRQGSRATTSVSTPQVCHVPDTVLGAWQLSITEEKHPPSQTSSTPCHLCQLLSLLSSFPPYGVFPLRPADLTEHSGKTWEVKGRLSELGGLGKHLDQSFPTLLFSNREQKCCLHNKKKYF